MTRPRIARDPAYLAFVREQPCLATRITQGVVAHHVRQRTGGGVALKPSDYFTVPLCEIVHARLHQEGEAAFWKRSKVCPFNWMTWIMAKYSLAHYGEALVHPLRNVTSEMLAWEWEGQLAKKLSAK